MSNLRLCKQLGTLYTTAGLSTMFFKSGLKHGAHRPPQTSFGTSWIYGLEIATQRLDKDGYLILLCNLYITELDKHFPIKFQNY